MWVKIMIPMYRLWLHGLYGLLGPRDGVSNHRRLDCLFQPFVQAQIKENIKLRATGLCEGNSRWPAVSLRKGPVTRKIFHLMTSSCIKRKYQSRRYHSIPCATKPRDGGSFTAQIDDFAENCHRIFHPYATSSRMLLNMQALDLAFIFVHCDFSEYKFFSKYLASDMI